MIVENNENQIIATGGLLKIADSQYKIRKMYVVKNYRRKSALKLGLEVLLPNIMKHLLLHSSLN